MTTPFGAAGILIGALIIADAAAAGTLVSRTLPPGPHAGSRERDYQVFVPDAASDGAAAPMVMVLHGCLQTEQNMIAETRFIEVAEREGFVAVFPFITSYPFFPLRAQNCWGFFIEQHRHEGLGEPTDLRRILQAVEDEFPIDPDRRYVAGLSSGAAMAVVMAVAYSEDVAAAGAVAGLPYGENACAVQNGCFSGIAHKPVAELVAAMQAEQQGAKEQRLVPMIAIHSTNDMTVPLRNAQNLRDSWIAYYGASATPADTADCTAEGVSCEHMRFADEQGRTVVETVFYSGPPSGRTHFWVGDDAGMFADPDGPSATELLWAFFERHSLASGAHTGIDLEPAEIDGTSATIRGSISAEIRIEGVFLRLEGTAPQAERPAEGSPAFQARFEDLPNDTRYTPVARVVLDDGTSQSATGDDFAIGEPPEVPEINAVHGTFQEHILAGRIAVQQAPCMLGLGVCDADFNTLFFRHGLETFALHNPAGTDRWYLDPANIPDS
ncbi:MAG TPA: PHB depolymerase family esterase [Geminicoccaceae bacterium]|jgi:poly(hydroxyalkanoate) depolymerase family esterase|nr:PHB depolymerase family esterase [Geminicoccaceae bacterium]